MVLYGLYRNPNSSHIWFYLFVLHLWDTSRFSKWQGSREGLDRKTRPSSCPLLKLQPHPSALLTSSIPEAAPPADSMSAACWPVLLCPLTWCFLCLPQQWGHPLIFLCCSRMRLSGVSSSHSSRGCISCSQVTAHVSEHLAQGCNRIPYQTLRHP